MNSTQSQSKIPSDIFTEINKLTLRYIWMGKGTRITIIILEKRNEVGGLTLPGSLQKCIYQDIVELEKGRQIDQWNCR